MSLEAIQKDGSLVSLDRLQAVLKMAQCPKSYTWMHSDANLSLVDKALIIDWATRTSDSIKAKK